MIPLKDEKVIQKDEHFYNDNARQFSKQERWHLN